MLAGHLTVEKANHRRVQYHLYIREIDLIHGRIYRFVRVHRFHRYSVKENFRWKRSSVF